MKKLRHVKIVTRLETQLDNDGATIQIQVGLAPEPQCPNSSGYERLRGREKGAGISFPPHGSLVRRALSSHVADGLAEDQRWKACVQDHTANTWGKNRHCGACMLPTPPPYRKSPAPESGNRPVMQKVPQTTLNEQRVGIIQRRCHWNSDKRAGESQKNGAEAMCCSTGSPRCGHQGSLRLALPVPLESCHDKIPSMHVSFAKSGYSDLSIERGSFGHADCPFPGHWEDRRAGGDSRGGLRTLRGHTHQDLDKFPSHIQCPHYIRPVFLPL